MVPEPRGRLPTKALRVPSASRYASRASLKIEDVFAAEKRRAGWRFGESRKIKPRRTSPQRVFSPRRRVRASQEAASRKTETVESRRRRQQVRSFGAERHRSARSRRSVGAWGWCDPGRDGRSRWVGRRDAAGRVVREQGVGVEEVRRDTRRARARFPSRMPSGNPPDLLVSHAPETSLTPTPTCRYLESHPNALMIFSPTNPIRVKARQIARSGTCASAHRAGRPSLLLNATTRPPRRPDFFLADRPRPRR